MTAETSRGAGGELPIRIASAAILAAIALFGAWAGQWFAAFVVAAAAVVAHLEWTDLTGDKRQTAVLYTAGLVAGILVTAAGYHAIGFGIAVALTALGFVASGEAWRPTGVAYVAALAFGLLLLRLSPVNGFVALVFLFAVVWGTDTGAYFVGRLIGGRKLWAAVSPGKTWSGAIGGLLVGTGAGVAVLALAGMRIGRTVVALTILLSVLSQLGDLFESWVKRRFDAKDSGTLVPGHGGLLDRIDGLTFAAGAAALIGWLHGGGNAIASGLLLW